MAVFLSTLSFKYLGSVRFWGIFLKEVNPFIQQRHIKLTKSDSKTFTLLWKKSVFNKFCSFKLSINPRNVKKIYHGFHKNIKQHNIFWFFTIILFYCMFDKTYFQNIITNIFDPECTGCSIWYFLCFKQ